MAQAQETSNQVEARVLHDLGVVELRAGASDPALRASASPVVELGPEHPVTVTSLKDRSDTAPLDCRWITTTT